jgi:2',3'-cyclic-nucleotide 2'-phosphodiesterase (5'-nucleotidase family)
VYRINGVKVGIIGAELANTPELVSAGATAGLTFLPEAERIKAESARLRKKGVQVQLLLIHQGTANGANAIDGKPAVAWNGPIVDIVNQLQGTTIDAVIAGHTHRVTNTMVGHIPVVEGINAGATYSVLQLMVKGGDVTWVGANTRIAKNLGVAPRADVKAIVDDANAQTAVLRNQVIGTQASDIKRDPARLHESAVGNLWRTRCARSTRVLTPPTPTRVACGRTSTACQPRPRRRHARSPGARCSPCCRSGIGR